MLSSPLEAEPRRKTSVNADRSEPKQPKMLFFRKIATMRRKRTQTQYHSYYQGFTAVFVLILTEFVWMRQANSQGLGAGTPPLWAEGREALKGGRGTKPKGALESRDA